MLQSKLYPLATGPFGGWVRSSHLLRLLWQDKTVLEIGRKGPTSESSPTMPRTLLRSPNT